MRAKRSTPEAAIENCDPSQLAEEAETQVVMNKTKRQKFTKGLSTPGEHAGKSVGEHAGVIRSIVVENFMNHTHLRIDLDPHVNFIVGMNGSGKSAIVASLIAGLGEKASSTGRNTKGHASLIKHGCDSALIQIHLANEGKDAFKADEFPETVVVEHRLERAGGGGYKLATADGSYSRKSSKREVEELCNHFNIQAANPCAVLTQEAAKKFLHQGNEDNLYAFFLQAANLHCVREDLASTRGQCEEMKVKIATAEDGMAALEEQAKQAQEEYEGAIALKKLNEKLNELTRLVGWAEVDYKEHKIASLEQEVAAIDEQSGNCEAKLEEAESTIRSLEERQRQADQQRTALCEKLNEIGAMGKEEKRRLRAAQEMQRQAADRIASAENSLDQSRCELTQSEKRLERKLKDLERNQQEARAKEERAKNTLELQLAELKTSLDGHASRVDALKAQTDAANEARDNAAAVASRCSQKLHESRDELRRLQSNNSDSLSRIHPQMPQLVEAIERSSSQFRSMPVGPLGKFVKLNDNQERFSNVIETALGGDRGLGTFVVSCKEDEEILRRLAQNLHRTNAPPLASLLNVTRRPLEKRFVVGRQEKQLPDFPTVLDLVTISDDTAFNAVVDRNAETTYIFPSEDVAQQALDKWKAQSRGYGQVTGYCADTNAKKFQRKGPGGDFSGREPSYGRGRGILTRDTRLLVDQKQMELDVATEEFNRAKFSAEEKRRAAAELGSMQLAERKQLKAATESHSKVRSELQRLSATTGHDMYEQEIEQLRSDVRDCHARVQCCAAEHAAAVAASQVEEPDIAANSARTAQLKTQFESVNAAYELKKQEQDAIAGTLRRATSDRRGLMKARDSSAHTRKQHLAAIDKLKRELVDFIPQQLARLGERVADPQKRTVQELESERDKAKKRVRKQEAKHGGRNLNELQQFAEVTARKLKEKKEDLQCCQTTLVELDQAFKARYKNWKKTCKLKGKQAAQDFNVRLSRKGHAGTLHFSHEDEKLSLEVTRNSQDTGSAATTDARNLSGGERSYTTLAFELSMWEFCETPFRVLDEFDVYMDDTYRQIAVDTLLKLCDQQQNHQFIFITPQDMHPFLREREHQPRIVRMEKVR